MLLDRCNMALNLTLDLVQLTDQTLQGFSRRKFTSDELYHEVLGKVLRPEELGLDSGGRGPGVGIPLLGIPVEKQPRAVEVPFQDRGPGAAALVSLDVGDCDEWHRSSVS